MTLFKVLGFALLMGALFIVGSLFFLENIERVGRGHGPLIQLALGCLGALLGAIATAAQVIVDALRERPAH